MSSKLTSAVCQFFESLGLAARKLQVRDRNANANVERAAGTATTVFAVVIMGWTTAPPKFVGDVAAKAPARNDVFHGGSRNLALRGAERLAKALPV